MVSNVVTYLIKLIFDKGLVYFKFSPLLLTSELGTRLRQAIDSTVLSMLCSLSRNFSHGTRLFEHALFSSAKMNKTQLFVFILAVTSDSEALKYNSSPSSKNDCSSS